MRPAVCLAAAVAAIAVTDAVRTADAGPFSRWRGKRDKVVEPPPPRLVPPPRTTGTTAASTRKARSERVRDPLLSDRPYLGPVRRYPQEIPLEKLNARTLRKRIRRGKISTLDQALQLLPAELRVRSVLMKSSRSLQAASDGFPRIILYHPEGRLFVGIGTDANH